VKTTLVGLWKKLRGLFLRGDVHPKVIICDRDLSLMNAINIVFPEITNLICQFHINKNVKAKFKMLVNFREAREVIMEAWDLSLIPPMLIHLRSVLNILNVYVPSVHYRLNT